MSPAHRTGQWGTAYRRPGPPPFAPLSRAERKIDLSHQWQPTHHRSGWSYALKALNSLHKGGTILFDGFLEKKFGWGQDPGDRNNNPRPYSEPWIGFLHNPPRIPHSFNDALQAPDEILSSPLWRESMRWCQGLFTLSQYLRVWLATRVSVPVCSLVHPTETPTVRFDVEKYRSNREKKLLQVGWWLRRHRSIYELRVPSLQKVMLQPFLHMEHIYRAELEDLDTTADPDSVQILPYLPDSEYDELLSQNIVFLHLYDSSATNTIVECIVRSTPVLVNPLPAVVEYLGPRYPLYFTDLEEAAQKGMDTPLLLSAHDYLNRLAIRRRVTADYFTQSFADSYIYRNLALSESHCSTASESQVAPGFDRPFIRLPPPPDLSVAPRPAPPKSISEHAISRESVTQVGTACRQINRPAPQITILTSVFAADKDLTQFLDNITSQTIFADCELLLFDVSSSHSNPSRVQEEIARYRAIHPNIWYIELHSDPGLYEIWNCGIEISRADYITNANLDDRRAPSSLEQQCTALRTRDDIDLVCNRVLVTHGEGETWESNGASALYFEGFDREGSATSSLGSRTEFGLQDLFLTDSDGRWIDSYNIPHCMPMWRKSLHPRFGLFNPRDYGAIADWEFWIRCASQGALFLLLPRTLGLYRINPLSHNRRDSTNDIKQRVIRTYWTRRYGW